VTRLAALLLILLMPVVAGAQLMAWAGPQPGDTIDPILAPAAVQFVADEGAIDYTPTVTQGTDLTFTAASLPSGASINASTGAVTGTLSTPAVGWFTVTATNAADETYTQAVAYHVYSSSTNVSDTGAAVQQLDDDNTRYVLTGNVTVDETAFCLTGSNQSLDLAGFTITANNTADVTPTNCSFETAGGTAILAADWDFSAAAHAERYLGGTFNYSEYWAGDASVRFADTTATESIVHSGTITLESNTTYTLTVMAEYGGQGTDANPGVVMYAELDNETDTYTASKNTQNNRGMQCVLLQFTTGVSPDPFTLRVGITGHASGAVPVYIDDVQIHKTLSHAIVCGTSGTTDYPDLGVSGDSNSFIICNGTIAQGTDKATQSAGIWAHASATSIVSNVDFAYSGIDNKAIRRRSTSDWLVQQCEITCDMTTITSRDDSTGSVLYWVDGIVEDNTILNAPHVVWLDVGEATTLRRNTVRSKMLYVNGYVFMGGAAGNDEIYGNIIDCDETSYSARGIFAPGLINVHDNLVEVQTLNNVQESEGVPIGGSYAFQSDEWTGGSIYGNTFVVRGSYGGKAFRLDPDTATDVLEIYDNTITCDVDANPAMGTNASHAACLRFTAVDGADINFHDNTLTTNCTIAVDGNCTDVQYVDCTLDYIDETIDGDYPWVTNEGNTLDVILTDCTYDSTTKTYLDAAPVVISGLTADTTSVSMILRNTATLTFTDTGTPVASTAAVIVDSAATEFFNSTTSGAGVATFTASDISRINGVRTAHNDYSATLTGYVAATVTIDETNKTQTVPVTE
jgi:Putative Ig domain